MGFTPAAWEMWPTYNYLGRGILTIFLFICHFLIVTILITVLTNSFMAIVQNANEEHQFLFAVNTISMVKSDALFSYIPPTNLFGWVATPFRWFMPFRVFVKANRTIIKVSHFPILLSIFTYERIFLARNAYEPTDLIERRSRARNRAPAFSLKKNAGPFSPGNRLREPSIVSFHKERALDEVFRRPFQDATIRTKSHTEDDGDHRRSTNVVGSWMRGVSNEGGASPPMEQPRSIVERLENRARPGVRRIQTAANRAGVFKRDLTNTTRSLTSEHEESSAAFPRGNPHRIVEETDLEMSRDDHPQETDADGDDELLTNDDHDAEGDNGTATGYGPTDTPDVGPDVSDDDESGDDENENKENISVESRSGQKDYFGSAVTPQLPGYGSISHATKARILDANPRRKAHERHASSQTILFSPVIDPSKASSSASEQTPFRPSRPVTIRNSGSTTPIVSAPAMQSVIRKPPKPFTASNPRPVLQSRPGQQTMPNIHFDLGAKKRSRPSRQPSFNAMALDLASDLGDNRYGPDPTSDSYQPGIPSSFSEQMLRERDLEREMERRRAVERRRSEDEEKGRVGRIMLARMNTLEEGFREVLREVKDLASAAGANSSRGNSELGLRTRPGSSSQLALPKAPLGGKGVKLGKSPRKAGPSRKGKERFRESFGLDDDETVAAGPASEDLSPGTAPMVMSIADLGIPIAEPAVRGERLRSASG